MSKSSGETLNYNNKGTNELKRTQTPSSNFKSPEKGNIIANEIKLQLPVLNPTLSVGSNNDTNLSNQIDVSSCLCQNGTLRRGKMLGIARPYWLKVSESEC